MRVVSRVGPTNRCVWRAASLVSPLVLILVMTQPPKAYSIEVSRLATTSSCDVSNSDFHAALKQLADAVTKRTDLPSEPLLKYFTGCTIEKAQEFFAANGFDTGESELAFGDREAGIVRTVLAEKTMRLFSQFVSLNCRIIMDEKTSSIFDMHGFFYFDGP